jgi:hypothetical protein
MFRTATFIALFLSPFLSPQVQPPKPIQASGIVEAVIGSGDMKLGRFARILFIPTASAGNVKSAVGEAQQLLGSKLQSQDDTQQQIGEMFCTPFLLRIRQPMDRLYETAKSNPGNSAGIMATDADENGEFHISGLRDVPYTVVAIGRVGMNAAFWMVDVPESSLSKPIKLVKPNIGCYDPNSQFKPN